MKLHLPKCLYAAVVSAAMVTTAYAGNVADVTDTVKDYTGTPSYTTPVILAPTYIGTDTKEIMSNLQTPQTYTKGSIYLRPVTYDANGQESNSDSVISNYGSEETPYTIKTSLYVREGTLTFTGCNMISDLTAGQYKGGNKYYAGIYQTAFQISGKNATLVFDNSSFSSALKADGHLKEETDMVCVGGRDGAGTMIITGGSNVRIGTSLLVGSQKFGGAYGCASLATSKETSDTSVRYEGEYVDDDGDGMPDEKGAYNALHSNKILSKGTFVLDGGSKLELGGGLTAGESDILISGKGTIMETCTVLVNNPAGEEGLDLIARTSGSTSTVRVEKGAQWYSNSSLMTMAHDAFETKATITVDGEGSLISVKNALNLGWGSKKYSPYASASGGTVAGSTELYITNGGKVTAGSIIFGVPKDRGGANPVYVEIDSLSELSTTGNMGVYSSFGNDDLTAAIFRGKEIPTDFKCVVNNAGTIKAKNFTLDGGNLHNEGTIDVSGTLTLKSGNLTMGLSELYTTKAAITAGSVNVATADGSDYEVLVTVKENLHAGKYMLLATGDGIETAAAYSRAATPQGQVKFILPEEINGMSIITDEDGCIILTLNEQLLLTRDPLFNAVQAANWGVFKSSQAFTGTLWGPRENAVDLTPNDGKGGIVPSGRHIAWGTVYSSFDRQQSSSEFSGSDSSLYGAAIGTEYQFASGKSVGIAFGYDFGKVSPFCCSSVDQNSWHAAVYGRAANWKVGQRGSVALDWSVATGSTTSDCNELGADWTQENVQLDARATYAYQLSDRTAISAFVGAQYYAQNDDSTDRVEADSLQNLRLMLGAGINYRLTSKTTVYGEVSMYNDTMRHNPSVELDGFTYGSGANPGRTGATISAGAQYQLNANWALRGNYGFETSDDKKEHRVNVGASYSF